MKLWPLLVAIVAGLVASAPLSAQEPFYKGKVLRIIVGGSAGGGFDTYSRTIARHMASISRAIPQSPRKIW